MMKKVNLSFEETIERVQKSLKEQGFGILTEIDVKETLKKKLNVDYPRYKILGACNPQLAKSALDIDKEVGTLLPCNVIIYESNGAVQISIQNPSEMMKILKNANLDKIAKEAESKLEKVVEHL